MRYIFMGDSITDCNHLLEPSYLGLGNGYVFKISEKISEKDPYALLYNKGIAGFTLQNVKNIWNQDCLSNHPDVITLLIGMNDVRKAMKEGISLEDQHFIENYETLINETLNNTKAKMVLMEPFLLISPKEYKHWYGVRQNVSRQIEKLAKKYHLPYIPLQVKLTAMAKKQGYDQITTDGFHLTDQGHQILADQWIREMEKSMKAKNGLHKNIMSTI